MTDKPTGGLAYPTGVWGGMTLRDHYAGQAMANPAICTGVAPDWMLKAWFGDQGGIRREDIVAKQAWMYADAMIAARWM